MQKIREWINNPNRNYEEGLKIYHRYKLNTKHDNFFNTQSPEAIQKNMLLGKVKRIYSKLMLNPENQVEEKQPEPIRIKKIEPKGNKYSKKSDLTTKIIPPPTDTPIAEKRQSKTLINHLLKLNFNDLSFNDKLVFNNSEQYFLEKKTLMLANGDISKKMTSLHAKVKAIDPDPKNNEARKKIMDEIDELDNGRSANWLIIDEWKEEELDTHPPVETEIEKAAREAVEKDKKIKAHKVYIYRAQKSLPKMPEETAKQKIKKLKKVGEINKRLQELIDLGSPYKDKK